MMKQIISIAVLLATISSIEASFSRYFKTIRQSLSLAAGAFSTRMAFTSATNEDNLQPKLKPCDVSTCLKKTQRQAHKECNRGSVRRDWVLSRLEPLHNIAVYNKCAGKILKQEDNIPKSLKQNEDLFEITSAMLELFNRGIENNKESKKNNCRNIRAAV